MGSSWQWAGARWWKCDLHTHFVGSEDFGKGPDQATIRAMRPEDWILDFVRAEVDAIAITDHNSADSIDVLKKANSQLESSGNKDYRPIVIFPGVELSVNGGYHLLVIFDPEQTSAYVDSFLGAVHYRGTKGSTSICCEKSIVEVLDEVGKLHGLAIPAHVHNNDAGIFGKCAGTTLEQALDARITAMEVVDGQLPMPQAYVSKKLAWSSVLGSDCHHPSGGMSQKFPGSHFTWLKMSKPTLDGLRLSLLDGPISVKRSNDMGSSPNAYGSMAMESLEVVEAKYLGRNGPFVSKFNPWLNTLIGGRGTGKSTVVEFIRNVLSRQDELPKSLESDFKKYTQVSQRRDDDGLLIPTTKLSVYYRKDDTLFRISWNVESQAHLIEEQSATGAWSVSPGDVALRFPVRIYSQKQIFELAKNPFALLKIVDDSPEVGFSEWKQSYDELVARYLSLCAQKRELQSSLSEESALKGQLEDAKRKLRVFETSGHAMILKEYQSRQNQLKDIDHWEESWSLVETRIHDVTKALAPGDIPGHHFDPTQEDSAEFLREVHSVQESFKLIIDQLVETSNKAAGIVAEWKRKRPTLKITSSINISIQGYQELLSRLVSAGAGDPSEYGRLVKQRQDFEARLVALEQKRVEIKALEESASALLLSIGEHRREISAKRHAFLSSVLRDNQYVSIELIQYGNQSTIEEEFRGLIDRSSGFDKDIGSTTDATGLLSKVYQGPVTSFEENVEKLKQSILDIHLGKQVDVQDRRFATHIKELLPENIDRLVCWFPEDSLEICYRLQASEVLRPIHQGSPGQKTAALLAFLLSYGKEPLILDQPEDDLDNNLIYELIVSQLRATKQRRQVIAVTHNANVVVNGDSENIVVLDIRSGQSRIMAQGGLQESGIRAEICKVMEGGKEAFDLRYKRINAGVLFT